MYTNYGQETSMSRQGHLIMYTGIILGIASANERGRYNKTFLIGRSQTQNDPCYAVREKLEILHVLSKYE